MNDIISRPATLNDLKLLIKSLNDHKVDYMLIGGYALHAHGLFRATTDIDILVKPSKESGKELIDALLVLPDKSAKDIDLSWFEEGETIRLADEIVVDIMFNAGGETYDTLKKYIEEIELEGIRVKTLNLEGLLMTKNTLRDKDKLDTAILKKIINKK